MHRPIFLSIYSKKNHITKKVIGLLCNNKANLTAVNFTQAMTFESDCFLYI
jgi:hypothetical protein